VALVEQIDELPDDEMTPELNTKRLLALLQQGDIYARLSACFEDDVTNASNALETYENLIFDAGEGTELALRAQMGMGDVFVSQGDPEQAREFYMGTIVNVIPPDEAERNDPDGLDWKNVPFEIKQKRFTYVELGVPGVQQTSRSLGDLETAIEYALFLNNIYRKEGFQLSTLGYEALVEMARTFLEAGGFIGGNPAEGDAAWYQTEEDLKAAGVSRRNRRTAVEFALDLARQVATEAQGTQPGNDAEELPSQINERPEVEPPLDHLMPAAHGNAREHAYRGALGASYTQHPPSAAP